jgi:hypothetical protein
MDIGIMSLIADLATDSGATLRAAPTRPADL